MEENTGVFGIQGGGLGSGGAERGQVGPIRCDGGVGFASFMVKCKEEEELAGTKVCRKTSAGRERPPH